MQHPLVQRQMNLFRVKSIAALLLPLNIATDSDPAGQDAVTSQHNCKVVGVASIVRVVGVIIRVKNAKSVKHVKYVQTIDTVDIVERHVEEGLRILCLHCTCVPSLLALARGRQRVDLGGLTLCQPFLFARKIISAFSHRLARRVALKNMEQGTTEIEHGAYTFARNPARLFPFEVHLNAFTISHLLTWSLWLLYISVHFGLALSIQGERREVPWPLWIALLSELALSIPEALTACTIFLALCSGKAAHPRPGYQLCGSVAPSVDVMITCCGEPVAIIINTVAAAAAQDYPAGRLRIFVLDDGHDVELQHAVEKLVLKLPLDGPAGPPVIYLSRTVASGDVSYFKSGNLRFGIEQSQHLGTTSEFLAGLDADMIPEPDWLRRMVPHLLLQDKVALACGPQVT